MKKIIGLDLGTTSIGWAVVNEKENVNEESSIIRIGVRESSLTSEESGSFEKGKAITTNSDRILKRGARRNLQRYKTRRQDLLKLLLANELISEEIPLHESSNDRHAIYRHRALAATDKISLEDFARVLLTINKKRGYKSLRKISDEGEGGLVDGMEVAKILFQKQITPAQYLLDFVKKGRKINPSFYRSDLLKELDRIWEIQSQYYPEVLTEELKRALNGKSLSASSKAFYAIAHVETAKNSGKERLLNALTWRVDALSKKVPVDQLAYVICSLNGEINGASLRLNLIGDRSKALYFNHETIGQYLWRLIQQSPNSSLANIIFYRQDYEDEFNVIWDTQKTFYPQLTDNLRKEIYHIIFRQRPLRSMKSRVGFCELEHQMQTVKVDGKEKSIIIGSKVCPKASPLFQEFKIWQRLNDVLVIREGERRPLTIAEKNLLFTELNIKGKLNSNEVLKIIDLKRNGVSLNFKELEGNNSNSRLYNAYLKIISETGNGEYDLKTISAQRIQETVKEIFLRLGYKIDFLEFDATLEKDAFYKQSYYRLWHLLYSYVGDNSKTGNEKLIKRIEELCGFEKEYAKILAQVYFEEDYANLSAKAIRNILPHLKKGKSYSDACKDAGYESHSARSLTKEQLAHKEYVDQLQQIPRNSLRNPVVEKILNQMINVVNQLILAYGKPDEIRVELARELKKNRKERESFADTIKKNKAEAERIEKLLQTDFKIAHVSRNDIIRYRLYEELKTNGYKTLYSNTYIPKEELFGPKFNIEHIIPQARLFDDSFSNKTLETVGVNIEKGKETAYDYVVSKYGHNGVDDYKSRIEDLVRREIISKNKGRNLLMKKEDIPDDFIERELRNSQYIAKKALEILGQVAPFVVATTGSITSRLRADWQLVNVMQELNWDKYNKLDLTEEYKDKNGNVVRHITNWTKRNDNRHHAMDALTIAFTKQSFIQYLNHLNARGTLTEVINAIEKKELHRDPKNHKLVFNPPMPLGLFRSEAKKQLNSILISRKAKNKVVTENRYKVKRAGVIKQEVQLTPRGALHQEHILGAVKRYVTFDLKVNEKLTREDIQQVASVKIRHALLKRLEECNGNSKLAFGKIAKNPIWLDEQQESSVPSKVKAVRFEEYYTIKKPITPDLKIDKVEDEGVKRILKQRCEEFGGDMKKAFSNLDENPIWLNKEKGIAIKSVKVKAQNIAMPIHVKRDQTGKEIYDDKQLPVPSDFVVSGNNHHISIFRDTEGVLHEHVVPFIGATASARQYLPIVDKNYNSAIGWKFLFSMKRDEYFVFPNKETGFDPSDYDLLDPENYSAISPNLFRVQKMATGNYYFRHHLDPSVEIELKLKNITWKCITNPNNLEGIVKVRVDHIGNIVSIGEY